MGRLIWWCWGGVWKAGRTGLSSSSTKAFQQPPLSLLRRRPHPQSFALGANYPNPFNPTTTIPLAVPAEADDVDVTIYNVLGQPIRQVWNGPLAAGEHRLAWDGRDAQGQSVAAGVYLYRLQVGEQTRIRKMVKLE